MKISKLLKLSLVTTTITIFTACGGSSSNGNEIQTPQYTKINTIDEAKSSFKSISSLKSLNIPKDNINSKTSKNNYKNNSANCNSGGTVKFTEEGSTETIVANGCKNGNYYMDGTFIVTKNSDGSEKLTLSNITIKDSEINFSSTKLVVLDNENEHWSKIDGDINIISKCFSGKYNFKTIQKIYEAQDNSDNAESGILELNGVTYTFNNPYVTIKIGNKEETILQSELEKRMENTTDCSE